MITNEEAMAMAVAGRRLRDALRPADEFEDFCLQLLVQVVRVEHIEHLADMAERVARPDLRTVR